MGKKQVSMMLKSSGINILMTYIIIVAVLLISAVIPIPALRAFYLQVAILVLIIIVFILFGVTFLIISDLHRRRRRSIKIDILCCFISKYMKWPFVKKNNNNNHNYNLGSASTIKVCQYSRKSDRRMIKTR